MNDPQPVNQLFFTIFGVMLACLFAGTFRGGTEVDASGTATRRYWLLSVGTRAGAFFAWALLPAVGGPAVVVANGLFIFSAGCLALLFRSWRTTVGPRLSGSIALLSLAVGIGMETLRQTWPDFSGRMILIGSASLAMTLWTLVELWHQIRRQSDPSLKLIAATVVLQITMSVVTIGTSFLYIDPKIVYVTDNGTRSMIMIWCTMAIHLVIYLFIGGYLYRRALMRELEAVRQRNDVTALLSERERLLASLIASNRMASTGALSASVAHEISQPLQAVTMTLGLLRREIDDIPAAGPKFRVMVSDAIDHIGRAKGVLDHLRALFRQGATSIEQCSIHELLTQTLLLMKSRLDDAGVSLQYQPAAQASARLVRKEIQQVLINLLNNAIDAFTDDSHGDRVIRIDVATLDNLVSISVADNGQGIRPELADSLFELARSDKPDGMGIGLWISRYIIEDHHRGKLYVDRSHAPGTRFVIELPG